MPEHTLNIDLLDPILMLDNKNTKLLTAYKIDKGAMNILGKSGTPTKMNVPEP